jgi:hypothetical protein
MAKYNFQPNARVHQIFDDLEKYRDFCVEYGYVFDEATLYDNKSFAYRQHIKQLAGKNAKDFWLEDQID